jgi:hypothetical protein
MLQRISSTESNLLTGVDPHRRPFARRLTVATSDGNPSLILSRIDVETIDTGLHHGEGEVRRINFVNLAPLQVADRDFQHTLVKFELDRIVADVAERQAGLGIHAEETITRIQLCSRVLVRPNPISRRKWPIRAGRNPIVHAAGLHGNFAGHILHARYASRRILHLLSGSIVRSRSVVVVRSVVLHRLVRR